MTQRAATCAIAGLGRSPRSRQPIGSARQLAALAVRDAAADAGLALAEIDGLLINQSSLAPAGTLPLQLMDDTGLRELRLLSQIEGKGASVLQMVQMAALAVAGSAAQAVACVFSDAPLTGERSGAQAYSNDAPMTGIAGWEQQYGLNGPVASYALAAQRYLHDHALDPLALGYYSVACRAWSTLNDGASFRDRIDLGTYAASPVIASPLRLLDCAYPLNGAMAVIVTSGARARSLAQPPVYLQGAAQGHATVARTRAEDARPGAGALTAQRLYANAGIAPGEVSQCQLYDAFSITACLALEDYGFCAPGEAVALFGSGGTGPAGHLPVNTGGGHLADGYLQGMTPLAEAVVQARGQAGARQRRADLTLVTGSGGRLEFQAAVLLSPHERL